jgi:hypothetical protein
MEHKTPAATPISFMPAAMHTGKGRPTLEPLHLLDDVDFAPGELQRPDRLFSPRGRPKSSKSGFSSPRNVTFQKVADKDKKPGATRGGPGPGRAAGSASGSGDTKKGGPSRPVIEDPRVSQRRFFLQLAGKNKVNPLPQSPSKAEADFPGSRPGSAVGSAPSRPWSTSAANSHSHASSNLAHALFGGRQGILTR